MASLEPLLRLSSLGLFVVHLLLLEGVLEMHFRPLFFNTSSEPPAKKLVGLRTLA